MFEKIVVGIFLVVVGLGGLYKALTADRIEHVAEVNLPEEERFVPASRPMRIITSAACIVGIAAGVFVLVKALA